jgi:hypothetical protein
MADRIYETQVSYLDLEAEEMLQALEEFLRLLPEPDENWWKPSKIQAQFRDILNPIHLDLYHIRGMPCDAYLGSPKYAQFLNSVYGEDY